MYGSGLHDAFTFVLNLRVDTRTPQRVQMQIQAIICMSFAVIVGPSNQAPMRVGTRKSSGIQPMFTSVYEPPLCCNPHQLPQQ